MAGFQGTRLLIEGLYTESRLHVANLCQSTMLFGSVWVLLSQTFQHGVSEMLIPLRHCWSDVFSMFALAVDRFVGRRTVHFCFGLLMRCLFVGSLLRAQDDVTELFDLFDAHFWVGKVYSIEFGLSKAVLPSNLRFARCSANPFARNEVRQPKNCVKLCVNASVCKRVCV